MDGVTEVWEKCGGDTKLGWRSSKNEITKGLVSYIQDLGFQTEDNGNSHRVSQRDSVKFMWGLQFGLGLKADASRHGDWLGQAAQDGVWPHSDREVARWGWSFVGGSGVSLRGSGETVAPAIRTGDLRAELRTARSLGDA